MTPRELPGAGLATVVILVADIRDDRMIAIRKLRVAEDRSAGVIVTGEEAGTCVGIMERHGERLMLRLEIARNRRAALGRAVRRCEDPVLGEQSADRLELPIIEEHRVAHEQVIDLESVLESANPVLERCHVLRLVVTD